MIYPSVGAPLCALAMLCTAVALPAQAADAKSAAKAPSKSAKAAPPARKAAAPRVPVETGPAAATPEQMSAAEQVYLGNHECEFNQTAQLAANAKYPGYIDVKQGKATYLMKPVLSSTGAIRLEDVKGQTLMVQIASKSMLLDVKGGRRIVDDCVSAKHREAVERYKQAKLDEAAAMAAAVASGAASAPGSGEVRALLAGPAPAAAAAATPATVAVPTTAPPASPTPPAVAPPAPASAASAS